MEHPTFATAKLDEASSVGVAKNIAASGRKAP